MHDIERSQELAKQEEKFAIKKALDELSKKLSDLESELNLLAQTEGEDTSELAKRISELEEKERQRARDEFQQEISLDNEEGKDRDQFMFEGL